MIEGLVAVLQNEEQDSLARQNALGALQKFSLRRKPDTRPYNDALWQPIRNLYSPLPPETRPCIAALR